MPEDMVPGMVTLANSGAGGEGIIADVGDAVPDGDVGQIGAACEGTVAYVKDAVGMVTLSTPRCHEDTRPDADDRQAIDLNGNAYHATRAGISSNGDRVVIGRVTLSIQSIPKKRRNPAKIWSPNSSPLANKRRWPLIRQ